MVEKLHGSFYILPMKTVLGWTVSLEVLVWFGVSRSQLCLQGEKTSTGLTYCSGPTF